MEPNRFGRKLGIGVRLASRMAKERAAQAIHSPTSAAPSAPKPGPAASAQQAPSPSPKIHTPPPVARATKNLAESARRVGPGSRRVGEATRRFGQAFIGPLAHVSGTLWLEITGLFFAMFALFFAQNAYRLRVHAIHGPEHTRFVVYCIATAIFLYFCVTSFLKASRRSRKAPR